MFTITEGKGFHMTFSNGYTISVQWGPANYCSNRSKIGAMQIPEQLLKTHVYPCREAEVSVWDSEGNYCLDKFNVEGGDQAVAGWQSSDQVAKLISQVSNYS